MLRGILSWVSGGNAQAESLHDLLEGEIDTRTPEEVAVSVVTGAGLILE